MEFPHGSKYPRARLTEAPAGVHPIETPTPFDEVATVNSYLVEGPPLTLVDCGVDMPNSWKAFKEQLDVLGYRPEQVERIVITHAHPDHMGFARRVQERSGATIYVGEHEAKSFDANYEERLKRMGPVYREFFSRLGIGEDVMQYMAGMQEMVRGIAPPFEEYETLAEGDHIEFKDFELEVLYNPGHTYGLICLQEPERKFLFSNDHLLQETSPSPVLDLGGEGEDDFEKKFRSLVSYYEQIQRVGEMEFTCVLPGHGKPFVGHKRVIESLMRFYNLRQGKMWDLLEGNGPQSVKGLGRLLFPKVPPIKDFLIACEVLGNLEVLEDIGAVHREFDGTHYLFEAVGDRPFA